MASLSGTNVAAGIVPYTDLDKYATHDALYGKGGFRSVDTISERDAIPAERKTKGMIVIVNADNKPYQWNGTAWVEWIPKGNVTVDQTLNATSANAISNKAATEGINQAKAVAQAAQNTANNAIPKANIDQEIGVDNSDSTTTVPSSKAVYDVVSASNATLNAEITTAKTIANQAKNTAEAAIPKNNIASSISEDNKSSTNTVPSVKAVYTYTNEVTQPVINEVANVKTEVETITSAMQNKVDKSNISQNVETDKTSTTKVPSVKAVSDAIKTVKTTTDNQISELEAEVNIIKTWKGTIGNKNAANGVAGLDSTGKISPSLLPAGYDNVDLLVSFVTSNPTSGMTVGKKYYNTVSKKILTATSDTTVSESVPNGDDMIYINADTNKSYRWTGTNMVVIGDGGGVALGITSSTAFRGDYGNTLYTNFGSGDNLIGTQNARNFFKHIEASTEKFVKGVTVVYSKDNVELNLSLKSFSTVVYDNKETIEPVSDTSAGVMTSAMFKTLQELELQAFPLTVNASGGGTFEKGSSTRAVINISVTRKGVNVTADSTVVVTPPAGVTGTLNAAKTVWTPAANITTNATVSVKGTYGAQTQTKNVSYIFKLKKYWGTNNKPTLTNAEILALSSGWADSRTMNQINFDCTGGKYPYYVIPTSIAAGLEWWVGGLKNTDVHSEVIQLTNASGHTESYTVFRLNNIQTGVLSIQFK